MSYLSLVGDFVFDRIGPGGQEVYRSEILRAIKAEGDSPLHNRLANVGAGVCESVLDAHGQISEEWLRKFMDAMHLARVSHGYSDNWFWREILIDALGSYDEKARRLFVQATGMSDRFAFSKPAMDFCARHVKAWFNWTRRDEFNITLTPASIRLYERAGIEPHIAIIPAKRGGQPSVYRSEAFREAYAAWQMR